MDGIAGAVNAVEGALCAAVALRCVVAVIGERFARGECGFLADNALAFEHVLMAVLAFDYPATPVEGDLGIRQIGDGDEVNKGVRRIGFEPIGVAEIDETIKGRSQAVKFFARYRHRFRRHFWSFTGLLANR